METDQPDPSRRLGQRGRVVFAGGGGCSDTTTVALGSTARLMLEPQRGALPEALSVDSSESRTLDARLGEPRGRLVLRGLEEGRARVTLYSAGSLFDWLDFEVARAASADYTAAPGVVEGATFAVKLDEIYGACGKECPLIGGELLDFRATPPGALTLVRWHDRSAFFRAGRPQTARLGGSAAGGARLVDTSVRIVAAADVEGVRARILVQTPDGEVHDEASLPATVTVGSQFMLLLAARSGKLGIPLSGDDLAWSVTGGTRAVERERSEEEPPEGPIFRAREVGLATLLVEIATLARTERYDVSVE